MLSKHGFMCTPGNTNNSAHSSVLSMEDSHTTSPTLTAMQQHNVSKQIMLQRYYKTIRSRRRHREHRTGRLHVRRTKSRDMIHKDKSAAAEKMTSTKQVPCLLATFPQTAGRNRGAPMSEVDPRALVDLDATFGEEAASPSKSRSPEISSHCTAMSTGMRSSAWYTLANPPRPISRCTQYGRAFNQKMSRSVTQRFIFMELVSPVNGETIVKGGEGPSCECAGTMFSCQPPWKGVSVALGSQTWIQRCC